MGKAKAACYNVKQMAGKSNVSLSRPVGKHQVNLNADNNVNLRLNKYKGSDPGFTCNDTQLLGDISKGFNHRSAVFKPRFSSTVENQLQSDATLENMYFRKDPNELSQAALPSEIPQIEDGNKKRNACESITSNFQPTMREQSAQNGVTWAKWGEKGSPKAASKILKIKTLEERADRAVMSKAETSEETLIRRVRSTARLWHNMDNLPPKQFKRTSSLPTRSSRETYLETDPHSQGLSGHYKETYLIKKQNRFSPYGHPVL